MAISVVCEYMCCYRDEDHPKVGGPTPITSGVAFELMQDSTLISHNRQLFATKANSRQVITSAYERSTCAACMPVDQSLEVNHDEERFEIVQKISDPPIITQIRLQKCTFTLRQENYL